MDQLYRKAVYWGDDPNIPNSSTGNTTTAGILPPFEFDKTPLGPDLGDDFLENEI